LRFEILNYAAVKLFMIKFFFFLGSAGFENIVYYSENKWR